MKTLVSRLVAAVAAAGLLAFAGSASATTDWPNSLSGPGSTGTATDSNGTDFVTFYGTVASDSSTASTIVTAFQGQYETAVYIQCKNGQINNTQTPNGNAIVACPFFDSTITTADGTGSSN
jgi:hypothetical protein